MKEIVFKQTLDPNDVKSADWHLKTLSKRKFTLNFNLNANPTKYRAEIVCDHIIPRSFGYVCFTLFDDKDKEIYTSGRDDFKVLGTYEFFHNDTAIVLILE